MKRFIASMLIGLTAMTGIASANSAAPVNSPETKVTNVEAVDGLYGSPDVLVWATNFPLLEQAVASYEMQGYVLDGPWYISTNGLFVQPMIFVGA